MREIKFRGKQAYGSSKWVYGSLCGSPTHPYIEEKIKIDVEKDWWNLPRTEVVKDTIGQYTGLKDKNGKEIYEGDVVEVYDFTSAYSSKYCGVVKMYRGSWCVEYEDSIFDITSHHNLFFDDFADRKTTIIGNIYDNPDLIE